MVILLLAVQTLMIGCTGNGSLPFGEGGRGYVPQASDSLYTVERAGGEALRGEAFGAEAELSQHIRSVIIRERLYLSTQFDRQAAIDYFHLSKERYSITPTEYRYQNKDAGD